MIALVLLAINNTSASLPPGEYTIVTFGDSTTASRKVNGSPLYIYTDILRDELPLADITGNVYNHGRGGRHSGSITDNRRHNVAHALDHYDQVLNRNPDIVIMQFGINDSYIDSGTASVTDGTITGSTSRIPYDPTDPRKPTYAHNYKDNLTTIIERFKAAGIRVILMTSNHFGANKAQWRTDVLEVYVNRARQVADEQNVELIDVWQMYVDYNAVDGQAYDDLLLDGVHPNAEGHRMVADAVYDLLELSMPQTQTSVLDEAQRCKDFDLVDLFTLIPIWITCWML